MLLSGGTLSLFQFCLTNYYTQVVIHYVSDSTAEKAKQVVKQVEALGSEAIAVQADLQNETAGKIIVDTALKAFNAKTIDIIGMNAGPRYMSLPAICPILTKNLEQSTMPAFHHTTPTHPRQPSRTGIRYIIPTCGGRTSWLQLLWPTLLLVQKLSISARS